jgi:uncharacterized protein YaiL (DUF2058 family)
VLKAFANDSRSPNRNVQGSCGLSQKKLQKAQRKNSTVSRGHLLGSLKGQEQVMKEGLPPSENQHRTRRVSQRTRKRHRVAASRKAEEACTSKVWLEVLGCQQLKNVCCLVRHNMLAHIH